jgi:hypothetical protein
MDAAGDLDVTLAAHPLDLSLPPDTAFLDVDLPDLLEGDLEADALLSDLLSQDPLQPPQGPDLAQATIQPLRGGCAAVCPPVGMIWKPLHPMHAGLP